MNDDLSAETIFHAVRGLPPEQRGAYLQEACAANPAMRGVVEGLLAAVDRADADHFLSESSQPAAQSTAVPDFESIGHFRLVRELGHGAQATVYLARDEDLGRDVALKVLRAPLPDIAASTIERFRREAAMTARLEHPGICSIYEAGQTDGVAWIAMQYVVGITLAQSLAGDSTDTSLHLPEVDTGGTGSDANRPPSTGTGASRDLMRVVTFIEGAARALHVAHEQGLVHRDVKPGNLMVTEQGLPVVLDFGIAHASEGDVSLGLTRTTDLLGTPYYMAPEQLRAELGGIDRRADVYSLGVTLYECLTRQRPFQAVSRDALYQQILRAEPQAPRRLAPSIPRDLEVVLLTAMEKDRERRYVSALDFAEDLRRVREHEPIVAAAPSTWYRVQRFTRRYRLQVAAAALVILTLLAGVITSSYFYVQERGRATTERAARRQAEAVGLAMQAQSIAVEQPDLAMLLAVEAASMTPSTSATSLHHSIRDAIYAALPFHNLSRAMIGHDSRVGSVDLHPDGRRMISAALHDSTALIWDAHTGELLGRLVHESPVSLVRFSPDGETILTMTIDERDPWTWKLDSAHLWRAQSGERIATLPCPDTPNGMRRQRLFSPDSRLVAFVHGFAVRIVDTASGELLHALNHDQGIRVVDFSIDGTVLVTVSKDFLRIWNVADGSLRRAIATPEPHWAAGSLCFRPGSSEFAFLSSSTSGLFTIDGERTLSLPNLAETAAGEVDFSPDGKILIVRRQAHDNEPETWARYDAEGNDSSRAPLSERAMQAGRLIAVLPGGRQVVANPFWNPHVMDIVTGELVAKLGEALPRCFDMHLASDSLRIVTGSTDRRVRVWDFVGETRPKNLAHIGLVPKNISALADTPHVQVHFSIISR